jgi:hypothetical protein
MNVINTGMNYAAKGINKIGEGMEAIEKGAKKLKADVKTTAKELVGIKSLDKLTDQGVLQQYFDIKHPEKIGGNEYVEKMNEARNETLKNLKELVKMGLYYVQDEKEKSDFSKEINEISKQVKSLKFTTSKVPSYPAVRQLAQLQDQMSALEERINHSGVHKVESASEFGLTPKGAVGGALRNAGRAKQMAQEKALMETVNKYKQVRKETELGLLHGKYQINPLTKKSITYADPHKGFQQVAGKKIAQRGHIN